MLLIIGAFVVAFFFPVLLWLVHTWTTSIYDAQGCLAPLIVMAVIIVKRRDLAMMDKAPTYGGMPLVLLGIALMLAAVMMDIKMAMGVAMIVTLAGLIWCLWGMAVFSWALMPLSLLVLMLPLNYPMEVFIGFPMRMLATKLTAGLLKLSGLAVTVQGTMISTSKYQMVIDTPCSGIRTLAAMLLVGLTLAYLAHRHWMDRLIVILLLAPVAILANAVRNYVIALIGHRFGSETAAGFVHVLSGVVVFIVSMLLLILLSEFLLWRRHRLSH